jgi:hypothetical protein
MTGKARRMEDSAIYRVRIDIVFAGNIEVAIRVGMNRRAGVAKCAADMNVGGGIGGNQSGVVSAPRTSDLCDRI